MSTLTAICYHYLAREDKFRRIWGHSFSLFKKHLRFLRENYQIIDPQDVLSERFKDGKDYMLLTFDDGLKEHVQISDYLNKLGVKGIFAIPTCILRGEPSNPQIIHFGTAYYGIRKFYNLIVECIRGVFPQHSNLLVENPEKQELMQVHKAIKNLFKRQLDQKIGRKVLLNIFEKSLKHDFPDFVKRVYLDKEDIENLVKNGHSLAVHSDTHPVIKDIEPDEELMRNEVLQARDDLSELVGEEVKIFAYPFGEATDILEDTDYFAKNGYKSILTTYQRNKNFDLLNLGRYCSQGGDTTNVLTEKLWKYKIK